MEFKGFLPPDEFRAMQARWEDRIRAGSGRLPLFRIVDWPGPAMLGTWQLDASEGSVAHADAVGLEQITSHLEVITTTGDATTACSQRFLSAAGAPFEGEDLLRRHDVFNELPRRSISIRIDGGTCEFTVWDDKAIQDQGTWLASGSHRGFGIAVVAQGPGRQAPEDLALETVTGIEPLLASRRARLRRMRGED